MPLITLARVLDARRTAKTPHSTAVNAQAWLSTCPWLRSAYADEEAWYLAQQAAGRVG